MELSSTNERDGGRAVDSNRDRLQFEPPISVRTNHGPVELRTFGEVFDFLLNDLNLDMHKVGTLGEAAYEALLLLQDSGSAADIDDARRKIEALLRSDYRLYRD